MDYTLDGVYRNFTSPTITSTPKLEIYAKPTKPNISSTRRYSLSDIFTPSRITKSDLGNSSDLFLSTGPLLVTTRHMDNISTYEETKSSGLAKRVVQYNQENEKGKEKFRNSTFQTKYGSPGLFPIVHLLKKSSPVLEQKPRRVKVRVSSPGYPRSHSDEYKSKLLAAVVMPKTSNNFNHKHHHLSKETNTSTRSVLDALKEISRKRIHTSEDHDTKRDLGKRQKTDFVIDTDTHKRSRDQTSPILESLSSSCKPVFKKACIYDEYAASCSSTLHSFNLTEVTRSNKRKSFNTSISTENRKETKQPKLVNAQTQTVDGHNENSKKVQENKEEIEDNNEEQVEESSIKLGSPLKVFDDAPLERIRKNRLAVLMGSLSGKDPILTPKPTFSSVLNEFKHETGNDKMEKLPISILVTNKSSNKIEKHVQFDLPDSSLNYPTGEIHNKIMITENQNILSTPAPSSFPVASQSTKSDVTNQDNQNINFKQPFKTSESNVLQSDSMSLNNNFSSTIASVTSSFTKEPLMSNISEVEPEIQTDSQNNSKISMKGGGFKLDFPSQKSDNSKSLVTTAISVDLKIPLSSTAITSTGSTSKTTTTTLSTGPLTSTSISAFQNESHSAQIDGHKIGIASILSESKTTKSVKESLSSDQTTLAGMINTTSTCGTNVNVTTSFTFESAKKSVNNSTTFNFIPPTLVLNSDSLHITNNPSITNNSSLSTKPSNNFGDNASTTYKNTMSVPGTPNTPSKFGLLNSSNEQSEVHSDFKLSPLIRNSYDAKNCTSTAIFNSLSFNNAIGTKTSNDAFREIKETTSFSNFLPQVMPSGAANAVDIKVSNGSSSVFGGTGFTPNSSGSGLVLSSNSPSFTIGSVSTVGSSSPLITTNASSNNFYSPASTVSSVFENSGGICTSTSSQNVFGETPTKQLSSFDPINAAFPSKIKAPFRNKDNVTVQSFGSNSNTAFNFDAKTTSVTTTAFGATGAFRTTPSFGSNTFRRNDNDFGTTQSFGSSYLPNNLLSATPSVFSTQTNSYTGTIQTNTSVFGTNTPSNSFSISNNTSTFGSTTSNSHFGKLQTNEFISNPNAFVATPFGNSGASTTSPVFNFGSGASSPPGGVFSFGGVSSPNAISSTSFQFSGCNNTSAFGRNTSFSGNASFPTSGTTAQFGSQAGSGMFNIGSGSPSTRNRTMIRAKRRT